jgi:predicted DNA-binding protein with PD1-like motif
MKYYSSGQNWIVILAKGDELVESLSQFAKEVNLHSAWLSGLGGALQAEVGFYDLEIKRYTWKKFDGPLEITSLTGDIVQKDGKPYLHIHSTLSNTSYGAIGGHLKKLVAGPTCEIFVQKLNKNLTRIYDEDIGLDLINSET